jgi:hypothetical protein
MGSIHWDRPQYDFGFIALPVLKLCLINLPENTFFNDQFNDGNFTSENDLKFIYKIMNYQRTTKFVLEICPLKSSNFSGFCSITLCSPNANQSYLYFMQNSMNHKGKLSWISDFVRSGVCRKKKNPLLLLKNLNSANTKPLKCIKQYVCDYTGHFRIYNPVFNLWFQSYATELTNVNAIFFCIRALTLVSLDFQLFWEFDTISMTTIQRSNSRILEIFSLCVFLYAIDIIACAILPFHNAN